MQKPVVLFAILLFFGGIPHISAQIGGANGTGTWSEVIQMPLVPVAAANLPNGKILMWSAYDRFAFGGNRGKTYTLVFDPVTHSTQELLIANTQHDMFCPGTSSLVDGRVIVTGGSSSNKTSIYDPFSETWVPDGNMNIPRGYHAMVTLGDGRVYTIGGSWSGGKGNKHSEIWENGAWQQLNGVPAMAIMDGTPNSDKDVHTWLWPAPNGKLFHAGPSPKMHWITTDGNGSYSFAGNRGDDQYAVNGNTVMFDVGKILKTGGASNYGGFTPATGNSYIIDITTNTANVKKVASLKYPRAMHNSVVLPTGEVLVIGGVEKAKGFTDTGSRYVPEMWDPITEKWRDLVQMTVPRNYHSIALLLPDGQVLAAGGGLCGNCSANHPDAEIYSPSYLFNTDGTEADRPQIHYAPTQAVQNSSQTLITDGAIAYFALVRYNSVTHSTNNEQRRIKLEPNHLGENVYELTLPNIHVAIPGYYMLFAIDGNGVPSIAKVVQLDPDYTSSPKLFAKVALEGPYDPSTGQMQDGLRASGELSATDPFGLGETMSAMLRTREGGDAPVDWINIQLRAKNDATNIVAEKAVLVQRDGDLMDSQGNTLLSFEGVAEGTYYVAVLHGNHLGVMTELSLDFRGSKFVDFTNPATKTYSNGGAAQNIINGKCLLWGGDANADGIVNAIDKNLHWRKENGKTFSYGNSKADFNLDGTVNAVDLNHFWRANNSKVEQLPN